MPKPEDFPRPSVLCTDTRVNMVIEVMEKWFWFIEDGVADKHLPSTKCKVTMKEADKLIAYIDGETQLEITRSPSYFVGMDYNSGFERLKGRARIAFAEEVLKAKEKAELPPMEPKIFGFPFFMGFRARGG